MQRLPDGRHVGDGMFDAVGAKLSALDVPTLSFVAVCIAGFLGLFLIFAWLQQRNVGALAWWGSAYLIGASSIALWARRRRCSNFRRCMRKR